MRLTLRHARVLGFAVGVPAIVLGATWAGVHTHTRFVYWEWLASRPLGTGELEQLERCDHDVGWSTWLRVLEQDADVPCGEAFVVEEVAARVGAGDRSRWLARIDADRAAPVGRRMRAAAALSLAGVTAPVEAAWLLASLPVERRTSWTAAAARSQALGLQLGPEARAFGLVAAARDGEIPIEDALGALRFLAELDDPLADGAVQAMASAVLEADPELPTRAGRRPGTMAPVPRGWRALLRAHEGCEPRCAALWLALVERETQVAALGRGDPAPADPFVVPELAELLALAAAPAGTRRATAWSVAALTDWVVAAPEPEVRLRAIVAQPVRARGEAGPADTLALAWDGGGPPFLTAAVADLVASGAGLEVDVRARPGEVWVAVGGEWAVRGCSPAGEEPPSERWSRASIRAAALLELAAAENDPLRALRLATAARRVDPLVGGPTAERLGAATDPAFEVGRRIGEALSASIAVPTGAEEARRAVGAAGVGCVNPS